MIAAPCLACGKLVTAVNLAWATRVNLAVCYCQDCEDIGYAHLTADYMDTCIAILQSKATKCAVETALDCLSVDSDSRLNRCGVC